MYVPCIFVPSVLDIFVHGAYNDGADMKDHMDIK